LWHYHAQSSYRCFGRRGHQSEKTLDYKNLFLFALPL
jgi:hypothetical protein